MQSRPYSPVFTGIAPGGEAAGIDALSAVDDGCLSVAERTPNLNFVMPSLNII